jgi:hypothetical protein
MGILVANLMCQLSLGSWPVLIKDINTIMLHGKIHREISIQNHNKDSEHLKK